MNTIKKLMALLLAMLALTACKESKDEPVNGNYLYFQRNDFPGQVLKPGMTVKFRIYCLALILQDKNEYPFAFSPDRQYYYGFVMHE